MAKLTFIFVNVFCVSCLVLTMSTSLAQQSTYQGVNDLLKSLGLLTYPTGDQNTYGSDATTKKPCSLCSYLAPATQPPVKSVTTTKKTCGLCASRVTSEYNPCANYIAIDATSYLYLEGVLSWKIYQCPDGYGYDAMQCSCSIVLPKKVTTTTTKRVCPICAAKTTTTAKPTPKYVEPITTKKIDTTTSTTEKPATTTTATTEKPTSTTPITYEKPTTTRTTTTEEPTTTKTTTTEKPRKPELKICDDCKIQNGVGYAAVDGICEAFYQCLLDENQKAYDVVLLQCPQGLKWNQDTLTCDFSDNVNCESVTNCPDKKSIAGDWAYYHQLVSGEWVRTQCPSGLLYNTKDCGCTTVANPGVGTPVESPCINRKVDPDNVRGYIEIVNEVPISRPCAPGTGYNAVTCECTYELPIDNGANTVASTGASPDTKVCKPTLSLTFDDNTVKDDSPNKFFVANTNVIFKNGVAVFNSSLKSKLTVPGLSNVQLGGTVYVFIKYRQSVAYDLRTLFANGDCQVTPSLSMCVGNDQAKLSADTDQQTSRATLTLSSYAAQWHTAKYILDKGTLSGTVDQLFTDLTPAQGNLQSRQCGFALGGGGECSFFSGEIDYISLYQCVPPM